MDKELYSCITPGISTNKVVLTNKAIDHMISRHPESYEDVLIELKETILSPDYIIRDLKHEDTGLVIKRMFSDLGSEFHTFVVLKVCTNPMSDRWANSVISGWRMSEKRLKSYLRNKQVLYRKPGI